jgi:hypothetical protein
MTTTSARRYILSVALFGLIAGGLLGCASTQQSKTDVVTNPEDIQRKIEDFHRFLVWELFDRASSSVHRSYRETFLGKYEEYGDDLNIVEMEMKRLERIGPKSMRVEVEQRWYVEPDMSVDDDRFVEIWKLSGAGWQLHDRMKKKEWRRRKEEERQKKQDETAAEDGDEDASN